MPQDEKENERAPMVAVVVEVQNKEETITLDLVALPRPWVDELAFTGTGFTVAVSMPREMLLPAGSVIRFQVGRVRTSGEEAFPPFDPPYISSAIQSEPLG